MTDEITTPVTTEEQAHKNNHANGKRVGWLLLIVAFIIFILIFGYGYYQLSSVNIRLAQEVNTLQTRVVDTQKQLTAINQSLQQVQKSNQNAEEIAQQQQQIITEWRAAQKGDLNKWHVSEAHYLVRMANNYLQFYQDNKTAAMMLERAKQILQDLQDPNLLDIRQAVVGDLTNLQGSSTADITDVYLRLVALNKQLDQLPLPNAPLKNQANATTIKPMTNSSWWQRGLQNTWDALGKIVIVRYNNANALPLVLPDEKLFLYQNMHAQVTSAIWAVLNHNAKVYQASLVQLTDWINQYFAQESAQTKSVLQTITELQTVNIEPSAINLAPTLQLFTNYFSQTPAAQ